MIPRRTNVDGKPSTIYVPELHPNASIETLLSDPSPVRQLPPPADPERPDPDAETARDAEVIAEQAEEGASTPESAPVPPGATEAALAGYYSPDTDSRLAKQVPADLQVTLAGLKAGLEAASTVAELLTFQVDYKSPDDGDAPDDPFLQPGYRAMVAVLDWLVGQRRAALADV